MGKIKEEVRIVKTKKITKIVRVEFEWLFLRSRIEVIYWEV